MSIYVGTEGGVLARGECVDGAVELFDWAPPELAGAIEEQIAAGATSGYVRDHAGHEYDWRFD